MREMRERKYVMETKLLYKKERKASWKLDSVSPPSL